MPTCKIAAWNIYFSWTLVQTHQGKMRIKPVQKRRATNVARIINDLDADILGIVECMSKKKLSYFRDEKCPQYDGLLLNQDKERYTLGLLYKKDKFKIRKLQVNTKPWKAKIGNDRVKRSYKFARPPLVVVVEERETEKQLILALTHAKSKRPSDGLSRADKALEAVVNRKRIVAEGLKLRELLFTYAENNGPPYDRFIVMGDINDGPDFDNYEKQIFQSGIQALLGSVLDPDKILFCAIDLSNGKGEPSSSFANGSVQLDHLVYTQNMKRGAELPKIIANSGDVREDLVNIKRDGKKRDSDHAPIEVKVKF